MSTGRMSRRRKTLWDKDNRCRRCFRPTILPEDLAARFGLNPSDPKWLKQLHKEQLTVMATIQHMRSRLNPMRGSDFEVSTTLYCWDCNQLDSAEEVQRDIQRRAGYDKIGVHHCDGCTMPKGMKRRACPCGAKLCHSCQRALRHMLHRARALRKRLKRLSWHL